MRHYAEWKDDFKPGVESLDQNKDDMIQLSELARTIPTEHVVELLSFVDKSKDGKVTIAEVVLSAWKYEVAKYELS